EEEHFLASDPSALTGYTRDVVYLEDRQLCQLLPEEYHIFDQGRTRVTASVRQIDWQAADADRGQFEHYMLKEIHEQPQTLENAMRGRLCDAECTAHFGGLNLDAQALRKV